jgi:hypothetical protein
MKAAIITVAGKAPAYGDFNEPVAGEGKELITVSALALSQFSKSRSSGPITLQAARFHAWQAPTVSGVPRMGVACTSSFRTRLTEH